MALLFRIGPMRGNPDSDAAERATVAMGLLDTSTLDLGETIAWALVWFVVGFTTYALALAALSSLVSRQEDVGSVTAPSSS